MLHRSKLYFKNNASTILTCVGAVGVVATTISAVKATPKAMTLLENAKREKGEKLTKLEKAKTVAPVYIPTLVIGTTTVACIFGANVLNKRQQAAITSAYALLDSSYKEYKNKVIDLYGKEGEEEVREEIAKDNYKETDIEVSDDCELFYDEFSKRYFESTLFKVQQAQYKLNRDLALRDYAYLNEYYDYLGLPEHDAGWNLGWSTGACIEAYWQNWIDFGHKKVTMDDGLECHIITMFQEPLLDFEDYS